MSMQREAKESPLVQGIDERIAYTVTTTPWGSTPTSPVVVAKEVTTGVPGTDVTATVFPTNVPTVSGDIITLSLLRSLTVDKVYRIEVQFTISGNLFEMFFIVKAET